MLSKASCSKHQVLDPAGWGWVWLGLGNKKIGRWVLQERVGFGKNRAGISPIFLACGPQEPSGNATHFVVLFFMRWQALRELEGGAGLTSWRPCEASSS